MYYVVDQTSKYVLDLKQFSGKSVVLGGFLGKPVDSLLLFSKDGIWNEDFKSADCRCVALLHGRTLPKVCGV